MSIKVISVNVGQATAIQLQQRMKVTGIRKHPVPGRVRVGELGLEGDHIANKKYHGGPDQAVYIYTREDYDFWLDALNRKLERGTFGENLVVSGLESATVGIGSRLECGELLMEVTAARLPCPTLSARMGDPEFKQRFIEAGRPGFYLRVLRPGDIGRGDELTWHDAPEGAPTVAEHMALHYARRKDQAQIERFLRYPVSIRLREKLEEYLHKA